MPQNTVKSITHGDGSEERLSTDIVQNMSREARDKAHEELSHIAPGPSEPLRFGDEGQKTQISEDPISEVNPFQESLP